MKKLKLLPSLKEKKRYILIEIEAKNKAEVQGKIDEVLLGFLGTLGYGKAGPMLIGSAKKDSRWNVVLSINRKELENVKAAFAYAKIRCLKVFGTLKKAKGFL